MNENEVIKVIDRYFSDRSRTPQETADGLWSIKEDVDEKIQAIEAQIEEDEIGSIG